MSTMDDRRGISDGSNERNDSRRSDQYQQGRYRFSLEELRVLRECNRESFYYRSLPMASLGALAVHYAVRQGYLRGHSKYGSTFKILGVSAFSWFLGKVSYRKTCEEKLMKLPNSQFAEMLKKRTGGYTELLTTEIPGTYEKPYVSKESKYPMDHVAPRTLNIDKFKQNEGLDDSQRPNIDNSEFLQRKEDFELNLPESKASTTYEELRRQNREDYEHRQRAAVSSQPSPSVVTTPHPYSAKSSNIPRTQSQSETKNQYGDVWEE